MVSLSDISGVDHNAVCRENESVLSEMGRMSEVASILPTIRVNMKPVTRTQFTSTKESSAE